jgi:putative PIN family toxin of toxin-antitoxin system
LSRFLGLCIESSLQSFALVTSSTLLDELDEKLRGKFGVSPEDADMIRVHLESCALVVTPTVILEVIKEDPDDDRVLECSVAGKADYVVGGDRHLLKLGSYQGTPIMTVREFMDAIDGDY